MKAKIHQIENSAERFSPKLDSFCMIKANCPLIGPGPTEDMSSMGVFLRNPSPYLR